MKSHESGRLSKVEMSSGSPWVDLASMGMRTIQEERAEARKLVVWLIKVALLMGIVASGVLMYELRGFIESMRVIRRVEGPGAPTKLIDAPELKKELRSAVLPPMRDADWMIQREEAPVAVEAVPEPPKQEEVPPVLITDEDLSAGNVRKRLDSLREGQNTKPLLVRPEGVL